MMDAKYIIGIILCCLVKFTSAQCWNEKEIPSGFKDNCVYKLDSLIVSEKIYAVLNHSIALIDTFSVDRNETWLYFKIYLRSWQDSIGCCSIRVELRQGVEYDILMFDFKSEGDRFLGAFCYKGYTYFVLSDNNELTLFNEFFQPNNKKDFHVYYKSPELMEAWINLDNPYMQKFVYLFYKYKNGSLRYSSTVFMQ